MARFPNRNEETNVDSDHLRYHCILPRSERMSASRVDESMIKISSE